MKRGLVVRFALLLALFGLPLIAAAQEQEAPDPIQGVNRGIFWFNDRFDVYLAEPVARGYDKVMPNRAQNCVDNFFRNLRYPAFLFSDLVQLKFVQAASDTGRFLLNTTAGVAGLFDVAQEVGLERHRQDFGVALGYWGAGPGPYLVLPLLGPSNLRDTVGLAVDMVLDPVFWIGWATDMSSGEAWAVGTGVKSLHFINVRAGLLEAIESAKESSLDYYLFMQSAYGQYRDGLIKGARGEAVQDEFEDDLQSEGPALYGGGAK
jgi:phospholipid-binding lipoprotein MlaA